MIIGNGLIAKSVHHFENEDTVLIFAAGVSNSSEILLEAFEKEHNLLLSAINENPEKRFIYFSTCSIYDESLKNSPYLKHKLSLENEIKNRHTDFLIVRLPNMVGHGGNPKTMVNYFVNCIKNQQSFTLQNSAYRNLLDCEELYPVLKKTLELPLKNEVINIANPINYKVSEIVKTIEEFLGKKGVFSLIDGGTNYGIELGAVKPILFEVRKDYSLNYLTEMLQKYVQR
jgi:UDP-2-acetamido-2,6-beta-L-arabino-hexul-4-ose reductase